MLPISSRREIPLLFPHSFWSTFKLVDSDNPGVFPLVEYSLLLPTEKKQRVKTGCRIRLTILANLLEDPIITRRQNG